MVNTPNRSYSAAHFALALDGIEKVGLFRSIEGGNVKADVMTYQYGAHYDRWRQLGKPHFEDIKLQIGMSIGKPFYDWIANFFTGVPDRKDGNIIAADFYYKERARRHFTNAMIKELTFPKLDGSDKNAAYLGIGLAVEGMTFVKGSGEVIKDSIAWDPAKLWTACNFRFKISTPGPLSESTGRVSKVDSFTIKMNVIEYHGGGHRAPIKTPSQIDFPPISFYVPEADAQPFYDHVHNQIIKEKAVDLPKRIDGYIETYDNQNHPLFFVNFIGAQVLAVTPEKSDASSEEIKQVKIDIHPESMEFSYPRFEVE